MTVAELIDEVLSLTKSSEEMAFFYFPAHISRHAGPWGPEERKDAEWQVAVGNPTSVVMLGEVSGEYETEGPTLDAALVSMIALLKSR